MSDAWLVPIAEAPAECGRKADRLRLIAQAGQCVPPSWILPFESYRRVLAHNKMGDSRDLAGKPDLPPELVDAVTEVYDTVFRGTPVVVRSSALSEDNAFASCAGQYDSFLNRTSAEEVVAAISDCYASLNSRNARRYQDLHGVDASLEQMAVIIQAMVWPDHAGVLFTRDPVASTEVMIAESVPGLGTPVVAGSGEPLRVRFSRDEESRDPGLEQLRSVGLRLEEAFGAPQDIEWGVSDGQLYIFQSRDITLKAPIDPYAFELPAPVTEKSLPAVAVSRGIAVGPVRRYPGAGSFHESVVLVEDQSVDGIVDAVWSGAGVLLTSGGVLSHLATVVREISRPALRIADTDVVDGDVVVVDAVSGTLCRLADVPPTNAKQLIFESARSARRANCSTEEKVETVLFDEGSVNAILARLRSIGTPAFSGVQNIIPFDYLPREYCSYSVRAQVTGDTVRVQYKRALKPVGNFRHDYEVHVHVETLAAAREHLGRLGLTEMPGQERALEVHHFAGCTFSFMRWPTSRRCYVGIDGPDGAMVETAIKELGHQLDARFRVADGVQIFAELGLSLDDCLFPDRAAVAAGEVRVDEGPW
ncbi:PEP/pyruvate-binding domain-containing protein [Micromonospora sp. NPDC002296]|uniref:PEP/pyruvate-binding domain-containing protein n=1 Tax=Micromonospora sp. NPDC002296 TaxID=3154271 RepID=UPI003318D34B